jgi:SAM-dependent methyltransferase
VTERSAFDAARVREHYAGLAPRYESKANAACARAYAELVRRTLGAASRVLEIGAGSQSLLPELGARHRVACDLSHPMLAAQRPPVTWHRVVADAQVLPFRDGAFDGAYCINVLEHVPAPDRLAAEAARVLAPGGRFVAVTPNGDHEWLLDLLEKLHAKLPEGPHRFLGTRDLASLGGGAFRLAEHRRFLAFPAGPSSFVKAVDRCVGGSKGRGLFQFAVMERAAGETR